MEFLLADNSFKAVVVLPKPKPLPSVSVTLPCVSFNAKMSKETCLLVGALLEELDELL